ncbi:MAG TPA: VOC family protein [Candidatus Elarobacter sp.]|nr:VOC family protein [Candidatus Elarobacter sp.]
MNTVGLIVYPATDLQKSKAFFTTALGIEPYADTPYYIGFRVGEMEIGLVPKAAAQSGAAGALAYVTVTDIKQALASLVAAGAETVQEITDVANGLLVASVKDPTGTPVGLRQFPKT